MDTLVKFRKEIFLLSLIFVLYFLLRLPNLTIQPIFADEAIYIRWAQVMRAEPTLRFLPLSDGKTPLFMWALMPVLKFIEDPLLAGRFLSVMSGFLTLLGVMALGWKVFGKKAALWAGLLYVTTPYTVFFDRMALVDSMLSAFTIWGLFLAIWLARSVRLDVAMILGFILGGAWLTKTPAFINLFLLPITILIFKKIKEGKYSFVKLLLFWGVAIFIALALYNMLRLGPNFQLLSLRNTDYVFIPLELIGRPLDPFIPHLRDLADWFPKLLTWPVIGFMVYGLWFMVKEKNRKGWIVFLWALIPLLLSAAFLKTFTARYLLASIAPFLILAGFGLSVILKRISLKEYLKDVLAILIFLPLSLNFNWQLLTNPPPTSLPIEERQGYFEMWTAGYGLSEIAEFLIAQKQFGSVVVGTEGFFGTLPDGLYIYLDKSDIAVIGSRATISEEVRIAAKDHLTFFVGNRSNLKNLTGVKLIKEYPKVQPLDGSEQDATVIYQVLPSP